MDAHRGRLNEGGQPEVCSLRQPMQLTCWHAHERRHGTIPIDADQAERSAEMAIACMEIRRPDRARTYLKQALDLNPKLKGVKKLCTKLKLKAS